MKDRKNNSNYVLVLEAIKDLANSGQAVSVEALRQALPDLKPASISSALSYLTGENKIIRMVRGSYIPVIQHKESRIISQTRLDCGIVKLDIGDLVLTLTPAEARKIGGYLLADAMQFNNIEIANHAAQTTAKADAMLTQLDRLCDVLISRGDQ